MMEPVTHATTIMDSCLKTKMKDLKSPSWKFMFGKKKCKNLNNTS